MKEIITTPLTDEEIERILDRRYVWSNLEHTRNFLTTKLKEDPNFKGSRGLMVRQDIIEQYMKKRMSENLPLRNYDWSKVPEFITGVNDKFIIICLDLDSIEYNTCYGYLIYSNQEHRRYSQIRQASTNIKNHEDKFLKRFRELHGDNYEILSPYLGARKPITLKCMKHNYIFTTTPRELMKISKDTGRPRGGCPICTKEFIKEKQTLTTQEFIDKAHLVHGYDTYDYSRVVYKGTMIEVEIIDKRTGKSFWQKPINHLSGYGNNKDSISKGEIWIEEWLSSHKIPHRRNETIRSKNIGRMSDYVTIDFSFVLDGITYWIEYNGSQHYKYTSKFYKNERRKGEFFNQLSRDRSVAKYAEENNITLIVIPYFYKNFYMVDKLLTDLLINKQSVDIIKKADLVLPEGYNEYGEKI